MVSSLYEISPHSLADRFREIVYKNERPGSVALPLPAIIALQDVDVPLYNMLEFGFPIFCHTIIFNNISTICDSDIDELSHKGAGSRIPSTFFS